MRLCLLALGAVALLPLTASAQLMGTANSVGQTPFTITVNPQSPVPFGSASLSFLSDTMLLANATMTVSVNGKKTYAGSVQTTAVPLGKAGVPVVVAVTITSNGAGYSQSVTIQPQDVSLIAEPVSSAPPLYPGKPQVPLDGSVRVVAIANLKNAAGKTIDPANLSYTWTVDGTMIANSSGIGKQVLLVASPLQYRNRDVSVAVMSQDGTLSGGAAITLIAEKPTIQIYENDPLLGIRFDHALGTSYTIAGAESTLYAAPFSFSISSSPPSLQWFLNDAAAQTGNSITLRPAGSGSGNASLSLTASAGDYNTASASISLLFGSSGRTNLFGL
ncbi:hypothetical protein KGM48_00550 [Patescibacteria group bacterium]|nr:hypothetical protein [Patescibacteria group bacterium]